MSGFPCLVVERLVLETAVGFANIMKCREHSKAIQIVVVKLSVSAGFEGAAYGWKLTKRPETEGDVKAVGGK